MVKDNIEVGVKMKKTFKILSFILILIIFMSFGQMFVFDFAKAKAPQDEFQTSVKAALLIDTNSKTVIFEKDADKKLPIASMTKLTGLAVVFDAIENGKIRLEQEITVSSNAASVEGSEAFLDANKRYKVEDLIKTVIISSANDSMVALAESTYGSEDNFVEKMNNLATELGMNNTRFSNSTGLPCADHYSTARDLVRVYEAVGSNAIYKKYAKIWIDELVHSSGRKTQLVNTNRLIRNYKGCTGGKTGFTNEAGYCLTASATRGDMNLIGVVIGSENSKLRFSAMTDLFDYGFNNFENRVVVKKDKPLCEISVKGSTIKTVQGFAREDYIKFLKKGEDFEYSTELQFDIIKAPVKAEQKVGSLLILDKNNIVIDEIDIITGQDIDKIKINEILDNIYVNW